MAQPATARTDATTPPAATSAAPPAAPFDAEAQGPLLHGTAASAGRASGRVVRVADPVADPGALPAPADPEAEAARLAPAADAVAARLTAAADAATGDAQAVLSATAQMAADPALLSSARKLVLDKHMPAARAVWEAAGTFSAALAAVGGYMAERVRDVQDVRDRLVAELMGVPAPGVPHFTEPAVLVAADLAPADTATLTPELVLALVTEQGGPTSHTAILARSLGIPAVVGVPGATALLPGTPVLVDGTAGTVAVLADVVDISQLPGAAAASWDGVGRTADGHTVSLLANVGDAATAQRGAAAGAQGVGLLRTELAFLSATVEPTEAAQRAVYADVLRAFPGLPVTVRTLDAGADKPLPFLQQAAEPNPALGVRGLRVAWADPGVLDRQLAALVAAAAETEAVLKVMAPMVATAEEASFFAERARAHGVATVGVMVEIPAAVLNAREIAEVVDFVSVGTNDLAQYLFAADRQAGPLAALNDPWQPALLRLIDQLVRATPGTPVGVCGEAAADPHLAVVLTGIGVSSLSMGAGALAGVGSLLGATELATARSAAAAALAAGTPQAARQAVAGVLEV